MSTAREKHGEALTAFYGVPIGSLTDAQVAVWLWMVGAT